MGSVMAVYGYVRVSTARQAEEGLSLDVQCRQVEGYALMQGLTVERVFVEEGVSGSVPLAERPAGGELLSLLKSGDAVVAAKLDRAFRSALDALQVVQRFRERGVALHLLDIGGDVANGHGKLFMTIVAAFAEAERDRIRERIADVKRDQRERSRFLGGKRPFGWRVSDGGELVEDKREQAALARARELRAEGASLRKIAAALTTTGVQVSVPTLQRMLAEPEASATSIGERSGVA
jgi:DNA invertase Pin-like site-specific DNA recombinase